MNTLAQDIGELRSNLDIVDGAIGTLAYAVRKGCDAEFIACSLEVLGQYILFSTSELGNMWEKARENERQLKEGERKS